MTDRFSRALDQVFHHEGGFADHDADPGGATKYGITWRTLSDWRGYKCSTDDVRALEQDEAAEIYKARYWDSVRGDDLPDGVAFCVFDFAVNSGPRRAIQHLQKAVGATQDGVIGGMTIAAVDRSDPTKVVKAICTSRLKFMKSLKTWKTFGRGWRRRVKEVQEFALSLIERKCPHCGLAL